MCALSTERGCENGTDSPTERKQNQEVGGRGIVVMINIIIDTSFSGSRDFAVGYCRQMN